MLVTGTENRLTLSVIGSLLCGLTVKADCLPLEKWSLCQGGKTLCRQGKVHMQRQFGVASSTCSSPWAQPPAEGSLLPPPTAFGGGKALGLKGCSLFHCLVHGVLCTWDRWWMAERVTFYCGTVPVVLSR